MVTPVSILSPIRVGGSLVFTKNETDYPSDAEVGTMVLKDHGVHAYINIAGFNVWQPIIQPGDTYVHSQTTATTEWVVPHNLETQNILYQAQNDNGQVVAVSDIAIDDDNNVRLHFAQPVSGKALILSATGKRGRPGVDGVNGKSAYQTAVDNGFVGTEASWVSSLNGKDGINGINGLNGFAGKSAYQTALDNGFVGTEAQWIASLKGADGLNGRDGANGIDGLNGLNGRDGSNGSDGRSAYQTALDNGFVGTQAQWLASLKGAAGPAGPAGPQGIQGPAGPQGLQGPQGLVGNTGPAGAAGAQGPIGPAGPQGQQGNAGANGTNGSVWYNGNGAPSNASGADDSYYLDDTTGDVYHKVAGTYGLVANIKGGGGGSSAADCIIGAFPGAVAAMAGTQRYYPRASITITNITAWLSGNAVTDVKAAVRKNSTVVANLTITAGQVIMSETVSINLTSSDYLTLDVIGGTGNDLTIRLDY